HHLAHRAAPGPAIALGPGWNGGERHYAVGDRILIHATLLLERGRLFNGSVVTVTGLSGHGLTVTAAPAARPTAAGPAGHGLAAGKPARPLVLPSWFIQGRRPDGTPNV